AAMADLQRRQRSAPDDQMVEAGLGMTAVGLGRGAEGVEHCERAVQLMPVTRDAASGPIYLYVLAQVQARAGQTDGAYATLDRMFSVPGFYNETWVERDPGFAALRREPACGARGARWPAQRGAALLTTEPARESGR